MALQEINDTFDLRAARPLDKRTMAYDAGADTHVPYISVEDANADTFIEYRHRSGMKMIDDGTGLKLYWYRDGVEDEHLVIWAPPTVLSKDGILEGGFVTWQSDYNFNISPMKVQLNGVTSLTSSTDVTLDPADSSDDRIDLFIFDSTSETATTITGTPSTPPVAPDIDRTTQLQINLAVVNAGSIAPDVIQQWIFQENVGSPTEWDVSVSNARLDPNSTTTPASGTIVFEATAAVNGDYASFIPIDPVDLTDYNVLVFNIKAKNTWGTVKKLVFQYYNGIDPVGKAVTFGQLYYGFNSGNSSTYQTIVIPKSDFGTVTTITELRMNVVSSSGTFGFFIDNMQIQFAELSISNPPISITLTGDVLGTGSTSIGARVVGIKNKGIPTLATGYLYYTGTAWEFNAGSGGVSPTWQNTLSTTGGSILTQANTIDGGNFSIVFSNFNGFEVNSIDGTYSTYLQAHQNYLEMYMNNSANNYAAEFYVSNNDDVPFAAMDAWGSGSNDNTFYVDTNKSIIAVEKLYLYNSWGDCFTITPTLYTQTTASTTGMDVLLMDNTTGMVHRMDASLFGGGGGSSSKFGFSGEDDTAGENRAMDMSGFEFSNTNALNIWHEATDGTIVGGLDLNTSSNEHYWQNGNITSSFRVRELTEYYSRDTTGLLELTQTFVKASDLQGTYYLPLSVNGQVADSTGNIVITGLPSGSVSNGLSVSGPDFVLGGPLTGNTLIDGFFDFDIGSLASPVNAVHINTKISSTIYGTFQIASDAFDYAVGNATSYFNYDWAGGYIQSDMGDRSSGEFLDMTMNAWGIRYTNSATGGPDPSAILDLSTIYRGFLMPRMYEGNKDGIVSPATGLMVYQLDDNAFYYFNGTIWTPIAPSSAINYIGTSYLGLHNGRGSTGNVEGTSSNLNNIFIGAGNVGNANTTGDSNIAFGDSFDTNTTGAANFAAGVFTLSGNTTGWFNIGIGSWSLVDNHTGSSNIAIGSESLEAVNSSYNIGIGNGATVPAGGSRMNIANVLFAKDIYSPTFGDLSYLPETDARLGILQGNPTAILHVGPGIAAAGGAPIKLTSGTLLTTTEGGTFEFDGVHLYFTITNGGSRLTIV